MGKPKTDRTRMNKRRHRTEQYHKAAKRLVVAEEVSNRLEQHNFDRLVAKGVIVIDWYKMPLQLRALPIKDRPAALSKWEQTFGKYEPTNRLLKVEAGGRGSRGGGRVYKYL